MKKAIAFILCAAMAGLLLVGCGQNHPENTWVIAVDRDLSPFLYEGDDGKMSGIAVDILEAIAEDQGFQYELRASDWRAAVSAFTSHQADVLMGSMTVTQNRIDGGWYFSHSFYDGITQSMAMVSGSDAITPDELAGKAVAVVSGTVGAAYAQSIKDRYGFSIATFNDSPSMYESVLKGHAAACFADTPVLRRSIENGVALEIVDGSESEAVGYCAAVCDGKNRPFLELFDRGLEHIRASGVYDRILAKYAK